MYKKYFKRILDIIISIIFFPIFIVILILIGPLIYFSDKGTIFYNADRLGKNGKIFKMYKFRSMKLNAPDLRNEDGSTFNSENDPRLLPIGKFIRKTSIDEIPQIINVLIGEMSFIGPRPDLPEHFNEYNDFEKEKLKVLPGITGYNQAYFRNSIPWKERIKNDIFYIRNISFIMDIKIIVKTILLIIKRESVFFNNENKEK